MQPAGDDRLDQLIGCPTCDALHHITDIPVGTSAHCRRCGTTLMSPRRGAMTRIVMLAATAAILMIAAIFFPFLQLDAGGLSRSSSVIEAVMAFSGAGMLPLSIAVAALIVILPLARFLALAYALAPLTWPLQAAAQPGSPTLGSQSTGGGGSPLGQQVSSLSQL